MTDLTPDGTGHFTLNMPATEGRPMYSFTWVGDLDYPIQVSEGGYAEPVIGEFEMPREIWDTLQEAAKPEIMATIVMVAFETACVRWLRSNGGDSQ